MRSFRQFCCGLRGHAYGERARVAVLTGDGCGFAFLRSCPRCNHARIEPYSFEVSVSVCAGDIAAASGASGFMDPVVKGLMRAMNVTPCPLPHGYKLRASFWGASFSRGDQEYVGIFPKEAKYACFSMMMGHEVQPFSFVVQFDERLPKEEKEL